MYAEFFASQKHSNHYIKRVKNYVQTMYMHPLRVENIAQMVNLDRRYLSRVFKERVGCSIQEYIIEVRMEQAKQHLERGVTVAQTAQLCGYDDVSNFSKMFKKYTGMTPTEFTNALSNEQDDPQQAAFRKYYHEYVDLNRYPIQESLKYMQGLKDALENNVSSVKQS